MSNKQRKGWRNYIYGIILGGPLVIAFHSYRTITDRSFAALVHELDAVAVGLWFVLLGAAWLRAKKHLGRAERHWRAVRNRTGTPVSPQSSSSVEAMLLNARKDLQVTEVMWMALLILVGVLRITLHYMDPLTATFSMPHD